MVKKILKILKKIKLRTLLLLVVLLSFSSYSWMIFASRVSTGITAHVTAWKFDFSHGDNAISEEIIFDVEQIYPGMNDYTVSVKVTNNGELDGELSYEIKKIVVLGTTYEVSDTVSSEDLENMMLTNFPFKLDVVVDGNSNNVIPVGESKNVNVVLTWPFDSGNDELDTKWGEDAYEFYKNNSSSSCLHIEMYLKVEQKAN